MTVEKLEPCPKQILWGGDRLRSQYHKQADFPIAESWELSVHLAGPCTIAGVPLDQYVSAHPGLLGEPDRISLLIKLIDAKQDLSIQVHPDDEYARVHENDNGKTEMWIILDSEPGSTIYFGLNDDYSRAQISEALKNHTILEKLNKVPTHPGDCFLVTPGTIHAIGAGNLICEIQRSCNVTYRLYDYDRRDKNGRPRELHIAKALDVLNYHKQDMANTTHVLDLTRDCVQGETVFATPWFTTTYFRGNNLCLSPDASRYAVVTILDGSGTIEGRPYQKGDTFFVSADNGQCLLTGYAMLAMVIQN